MGYDGRASRAKSLLKTIRQVRRYDDKKKSYRLKVLMVLKKQPLKLFRNWQGGIGLYKNIHNHLALTLFSFYRLFLKLDYCAVSTDSPLIDK